MLRNLPQWTEEDILRIAKLHLKELDLEESKITLTSYEVTEEDGQTYYDVVKGTALINEDTTVSELIEQKADSEDTIKEYKTLKGLIKKATKEHTKFNKFDYHYIVIN